MKLLHYILFFNFLFCFELKQNLSDYNIFIGNPKNLNASENFIFYDLITPLFTDYAFKHRLIYIPDNKKIEYNNIDVFEFPIGSIIVKTFYYPSDFNNINKNIDLVETRLLVHEELGWAAYPYIWNDNDSDAVLSIAGGIKKVTWKNEKKIVNTIDYIIPNMNQCKGCHISNSSDFKPIGPTARQLNKNVISNNNEIINQLEYWHKKGILSGLPSNNIPKIADWDDPNSGTVNDRARAWLDINCAHCHNKFGPAKTSGLFLDYYEKDLKALGIYKTPIAAGRGSGKFKYAIVPGNPDESILVYRFNSTDPGIMMPELGRTLVHQEGLELIREWIYNLEN